MEPVLRNVDGNKVEEEKEMEGIFGAFCYVCLKNKTNKS